MTSVVQAMAAGSLAICWEICSAMWPAMSAAFSWVRLVTRMEVAPCWMR